MLYSDFKGEQLSRLGFGAMRLPLREDGSIDEEQTAGMVDLALSQGINYFDTAYPYHGGRSELVMGRVLSAYPRQSFNLADKFPGHQISASYDPPAIFAEQLQKCRVSYFDYYLLHNVCEASLSVYEEPRWGIIDYFIEQRRQGRIRHLGFSSHARPDNLRYFLDRYGSELEFCQIQLNYLDWTLQDARAKCDILAEYSMPVWVMEPLRGGKLAHLSDSLSARLRALRPEEAPAAWAFRWLLKFAPVKVILSGMSALAQLEDNLRTFAEDRPLSRDEELALAEIAEALKDSLPCTACRYCCDGCPRELDIPMLLRAYNDLRFDGSLTVKMQMDALSADKQPSACIGCGACSKVCPQGIDIPAAMRDFAERLSGMTSWAEICRQREEANRLCQQCL
ncbi:aldo/keto reductase [bacterium]|nr:aldo/keto reductase [bacterium]